MATSEVQLEFAFVKYARSLGCLCVKLVILNQRGWPDRTIFTPNGYTLLIEFKKPGGTVSQQQDRWITLLKANGIECHVCDDIEDARRILKDVIKREPLGDRHHERRECHPDARG